MRKGFIVFAVIILLVVIIGGSIAGAYNDLVNLSEETDGAFAGIDVQLQRRLDLIPNLVATVKGYTAHESDVLNTLSDARARLAGAGSVAEKDAANAELSGALARLLVVVENYPDLKADTQFTGLRDELAGAENRIGVARRDYNDAVLQYNKAIKRFPKNILAGMFGFTAKSFFNASDAAGTPPAVQF